MALGYTICRRKSEKKNKVTREPGCAAQDGIVLRVTTLVTIYIQATIISPVALDLRAKNVLRGAHWPHSLALHLALVIYGYIERYNLLSYLNLLIIFFRAFPPS